MTFWQWQRKAQQKCVYILGDTLFLQHNTTMTLLIVQVNIMAADVLLM